ncbi:MAG: flagellar basal-body MS-ring/collar protein FliF [Sulfuricurvum sp.]|uniref:flagellar basal-body MS-ring/collar protein FliF n=1 Tax=Sulfuricurvum sp. TaxID=2025608 RepID=UPI00271D7340|nr:flagellar basal-body MS-ring/collar protein FliF [Sulfuricurvum sp.]MDO9056063.1 flagellar basal-body MS-ring/collar protein FliF [Sulfuricurvum sp.]MDP2851433.1 flagellar basal-body MS-ring/collar protein FliF [Sulfuricurvum sp.]MDP3292619.1 flagellar basal-body MS-ring/collar protein FliF [Sulfuricurvum sp.]
MDFKTLFAQLVVFFGKLTQAQRAIIGAAVAGIIAFLIFLVVYSSEGSKNDNEGYQVLFDQLSSEDAAKVIEQLEKDQIPYRIPRENVIEVPKEVVYKERITIASMGIPKEGHVGFELFDKQEFGATNFDQEVKFRRALEGELARSIDSLSPVEKSSVSLALPKETLFVAEEVPPSASVMVQLYPDRKLTPKQIRGIKKLVAAAVPKLTPENVALIDSEGETLGDDDAASAMGELSAIQQMYKAKEEKKQEEKIINVLAPFIGGKDRVVAKVTIEYDFSEQSSTSEKYDPENVVRSEQSSEEKRDGATPPQVGGVPGAVSNIGPVEGLAGSGGEKFEKTTGTTNYEVSKTVSTTKMEFARIKRMTAAVVVDGKYEAKKDPAGEATDEIAYVALDETQIQAIDALVKQSIGVDEQRGDQVTVRNFEFQASKDGLQPKDAASKTSEFIATYITPFAPIFKYLLVAVILFIAYKKIIIPFAERMLEFSREEEEFEKPNLEIADDEDEDLAEKVQLMRKKVENQLGLGENFNEDELKYDVLLEKVREIAEDHPEEIASLIQALIDEESVPADSPHKR